MRNAICASIALIGLASLSAHAQTVVMDFQGNPFGNAPANYTEDGILQVATVDLTNSTLFNFGNPAPGYALNGPSAHVTWSLVSGDPFNFVSVDLTTQTDPHTVTFTVNYDDGAIAAFPFDTGNSFRTFAPVGGFIEVASIELDVPSNAGVTFMDNFTITVPEPTSLVMLGAMGVLMLRRR